MDHADSQPLRLIGYLAGPTAPEWPDPKSFVDATWDRLERETVADYLPCGFLYRAFGGLSTCRFCSRDSAQTSPASGRPR